MFASFDGQPNQLMLKRGNSCLSNMSFHSVAESARGGKGKLNSSFAGGILLPEKEIWRIFADMARSISHVHEKGFIHLDIKPTNFFVAKDRTVKLGDFGRAIHTSTIDELIEDDIEGDSIYMAPELLQKRLSQKADIFSLGATLLEIASSLNLPQNGPLWTKLRDGSQIKFSPSANRSIHMEELINRMMAPLPEMRPTIDDILMHPNLSMYQERSKRFVINKTSSLPMVYNPKKQINDENIHPNRENPFNSENKK